MYNSTVNWGSGKVGILMINIYPSQGIGGLTFFLGFKVASFNLYFLIAGGVMAGIGFYMLKFLKKKEDNHSLNEFNNWKDELKANGNRLEVDFDNCELKSNKYREKIVKDHYSPTDKYMALDELIGKDNTKYNDVDQSVIVFDTELYGEKITFYSPIINKEKTTLQFLLLDKKSTTLYIDKLNKDNYYFDIEFVWK